MESSNTPWSGTIPGWGSYDVAGRDLENKNTVAISEGGG